MEKEEDGDAPEVFRQVIQQMRGSRHGEQGTGNGGKVFVHSKKLFYPPRFKTASGTGTAQKSHSSGQHNAALKNMDFEEDKPRFEPDGGDHVRM